MIEERYFELWFENKDRRSEDEWDQAFFYVRTEVMDSQAFKYGNGKCGALFYAKDEPMFGGKKGEMIESFDLRYCHGKDLHVAMLEEYGGRNLKAYCEYAGKTENGPGYSFDLVPMPGTQDWVEVKHPEQKKVRL